jgi:hypothetical protein
MIHVCKRLLSCAVLATAFALAFVSSASALTLGVGWVNPANTEPEMPIVAKSGAEAFRVPLPPTNNNDGVVRAASENGVTIHAEVSAEYQGDPGLPSGANRTDFMNKLYQEVRSYGYSGSFWSKEGNTSLPKKYITTWEIWNEPNIHGIGAEEFGQFVSEAANTIQQASKDQAGGATTVLSGGLLSLGNTGTGLSGYWGAAGYLHNAYTYFASNSNVTGVAIHPYEIDDATFYNGPTTTRVQAFEYAVNGFHNELAQLAKEHGTAQKSLWITETGWPVEGPEHPISQSDQANALRQVVNYLRSNEASLNVKDLLWYNLRDLSGTSTWDDFCGLRDHNGNFRQSWTAFQEKAGVAQVIPQAPEVETKPAEPVYETQATLKGWVHPHGLPTSYHFDWGATTNFGSSVPVPDGTVSSEIGVWISAPLSGLKLATTYYYRVVATNALGTSVSGISSFRTPELFIGFEANTGSMWDYQTGLGGGVDTKSGMAPDTSPSVSYVPGTGYIMAFQDQHNKLWIYRVSSNSWTNTTLGMAPGTSPSIAATPSGYVVAFEANNYELWYYRSDGTYSGTKLGMAPGTSPSIAAQPSGSYLVAFEANNHELWYYRSDGTYAGTKLGMAPGTSPSTTAQPQSNYVVAFQDWNHNLWIYLSGNGAYGNTGMGMAPDASPSIAAQPAGNWMTAFEANNNELWYYRYDGFYSGTKLGMAPETDPSIASSADGGYVVAFQDWGNNLWTYNTGSQSYTNLHLGMAVRTSPSATAK